jgi:exoribonuclease-2
MVISADGTLLDSDIYRAFVRNRARLNYDSVAAWLDGNGNPPEPVAEIEGLAENLLLQDRIAQQMKNLRHVRGALSLETIKAKPVFDGDQVRFLEADQKNRANEIIENFMIAANGVVALYLSSNQFPSIRRVVRTPKRWERIVELAAEHGFSLPEYPEPVALEKFLQKQKKDAPSRFPDLSLAVVKLLGAGEYTVDFPGETPPGHFGLAVKDYTHSTAPNRRYTDLITHRLLKAALENKSVPYSKDVLEILANHCTEEEDAANKVERQVAKSAAALLLQSRIGERFKAIVTGAAEKGTWVRLLELPVEGRLVRGFAGLDVGQRIRVQLDYVDVERGYIDFKRYSVLHENSKVTRKYPA